MVKTTFVVTADFLSLDASYGSEVSESEPRKKYTHHSMYHFIMAFCVLSKCYYYYEGSCRL